MEVGAVLKMYVDHFDVYTNGAEKSVEIISRIAVVSLFPVGKVVVYEILMNNQIHLHAISHKDACRDNNLDL